MAKAGQVTLLLCLVCAVSSALEWERTNPVLAPTNILNVVFGNDLYVLIAAANDASPGSTPDPPMVFTSYDAKAWTQVSLPNATAQNSGVQYSLIYNEAQATFFIFDNGGSTWTSPDGQTWGVATSDTALSLRAWPVVYAAGQFVAHQSDAVLVISTDGVTWTANTPPVPNGMLIWGIWPIAGKVVAALSNYMNGTTLAYWQLSSGNQWDQYNVSFVPDHMLDGQLQLAPGIDSSILGIVSITSLSLATKYQLFSSTDGGKTWDHLKPGGTESCSYFFNLGGDYIWYDYFGGPVLSTDGGQSWVPYSYLKPYGYQMSFAGAGSMFFGMGTQTPGLLITTPNIATNWTALNEGATGTYQAAIAANGQFVLSTGPPSGNFGSANGASWEQLAVPALNGMSSFFTDNAGNLYGVGLGDTIYITNNGFQSWTIATIPAQTNPETFAAVQFAGEYFFYTGYNMTRHGFDFTYSTRQYTSKSLSGPWTINYDSGVDAAYSSIPVVFGNNVYLRVTADGYLQYAVDSLNWETVSGMNAVNMIMFVNGLFFANVETSSWMVSVDGTAWSPTSIPLGNPTVAAASTVSNPYWAFGTGGGIATSQDGSNWSVVAGPQTVNPITGLVASGSTVLAFDSLVNVYTTTA